MSELSVRQQDGDWEVWVDATAGEFQGACIGVGPTEGEAMADALSSCNSYTWTLLELLQSLGLTEKGRQP